MSKKLQQHSLWSFPRLRFPSFFFDEHEEDVLQHFEAASGLTVSEDEKNIFIEACVPGIKPEEVELSYEEGMLWIKAVKKEEASDQKKKFYRKSIHNFSYRVALPSSVDEATPPEAVLKEGILKVTFIKSKPREMKKIPIKGSNE